MKKTCDQIIPIIEKYFTNDGRTYMRAYLRKNANQKCQLHMKWSPIDRHVDIELTDFYSPFSNEGYDFRRPRMIAEMNVCDRRMY